MKYELLVDCCGDISIYRISNSYPKLIEVYHKSFNPGEDLKENLLNAFNEYERLCRVNASNYFKR